MTTAFKSDEIVYSRDDDEVFRVLFSNRFVTEVVTLDGKDVLTGQTFLFEPFELPAAMV